MSSSNEKNSSDNENACVLCFKEVDIYSIGICDHPVCFECSTRMRILCRQNECPICRADMPKVIFTEEIEPFTTLFAKHFKNSPQDPKYGLTFANNKVKKAYHKVLEHRCSVCPEDQSWPFRTFNQLKDHMRREHELFYCDICIENVRIFSSERRLYTRQELGMHRRKGDPDNTSHRGHPLCEFCDTRFMDSDELYRHMRRVHLFCHLCDADGRHLYYKSMQDLQKHFKDEHYLCEEGECKTVPLASAFRTEIDFKAHIASIHGRNLGKIASKQVRTLEVAFTLAPRASANRKNQDQNRENRLADEGAVGLEPGGGQDRIFHNPLTPMDFPALAGSSGSSSALSMRSTASFAQKNSAKLNLNDFPTLGNKSNRPTSGVTITTGRNSEVSISRKQNQFPALGNPSTSRESTVLLNVHNNKNNKTPNVSIQVNHKSNGSIHTQITTTAASSSQGPSKQKLGDAFPALGKPTKQVDNQPQWVQVKSKKNTEKPNKVAPAPQLPPKDLSQFPDLNKGKQNKKTSSIQVPVTNNWVNLNSLSKEQSKNNKNNANITKQKPKETETQEANKPKKKKKGKPTPQNSQEMKDKKTVSTNDHCDNDDTSEVKLNGEASSDSGSTSSEGQKEVKKPPPGFNLPPPPGFENRFSDFPALTTPNDLTFTTSSGQSYSIVSTSNYLQPFNATVRNQNIIKKMLMVSGEKVTQEFKNYSLRFHNGQVSAQKFYDYCKTVFKSNFEEFFPEMLVLLPDIEKQQELYRELTGKAKKNLMVCANCKQVIFKKELTDHYKYHSFESQFSSQMTTQVNSNSWNK